MPARGGEAGEAQALSAGYNAYQAGDYATAQARFLAAAGRGNAAAMNFLGELHAGGKGTARDLAKAAAWFRKAADLGNAHGQNNLGELYAGGLGAPRDFFEAARWFRLAAGQDLAVARYNLARLHALGLGVPRDPAAAVELLRQAVKASPSEPRYRNWLGSVYCDLGQYAAAEAEFAAILSNGGAPGDVWGFSRGLALVKLERLDDAAAAFESALTDRPGHERGVSKAGEAAAWLRKVRGHQERESNAMRLLAAGDDGAAARELEAALALLETKEVRNRLALVQDRAFMRRAKVWPWAGLIAAGLAIWAGLLWQRRREARLPAPAPPEPGRLGRKYKVGDVIGQGGMGIVFEALDESLGRKVAVKRLRPELAAAPGERQRFLEEARVVARLSHPFIVPLHEFIEEGGELYLVFGFVEGEPLSAVLRARTRLGLKEAAAVFGQACEALDHAHGRRVVHRDLKPSNIMVDQAGYARVMDFGLARSVKDTLSSISNISLAGTPAYMAPEQHYGRASHKSDLYALGVSLYEALAGKLPYDGPDVLSMKLARLYRPLSEAVPGSPQALDSLISSALEPDPKDRLDSARAFASALASAAALQPPGPGPADP